MSENIDKKEFLRAFDLWDSFKKELLYNNRYIVKHEVMDYLKNFVDKNQKLIGKDKILYRARMYTKNKYEKYVSIYNGINVSNIQEAMSKKSGFWGYNETDSFVPTNNDLISDGRANPAFIKYLYTAEDPYTAMVEVRPYLKSKVSIAEINVNEQICIADLSCEALQNFDGFDNYLMFLIADEFSTPTNNDRKGYIITQFIAEYIKTLGFEGIRFDSSLHSGGRNITVFNYKKCKAIGSKIYEISDICFEANGIEPENQEPLIHYKLKEYKKISPFKLWLSQSRLLNKKE